MSPSTYGADRRYGPASDLEVLIPRFLGELGLKVAPTGSDAFVLTMRPKIRSAMCDQMAGTGTDYSCKTAGELAVQFSSSEAQAKVPGLLRVNNRCGAGDTFMTIRDFSRYTADLVVHALSDEKERGRRPTAKC